MKTLVTNTNPNTADLNTAFHQLPDVNVDMEKVEQLRRNTEILQDELEDRLSKLEILDEEFRLLYPICKKKLEDKIG